MALNNKDIVLTENLKLDIDVENSLQKLIDRHSGIFLDVVNNHIPNNSRVCDKKEVIDSLPYHVYNAGMKYDKTKGAKFSTFLGNETRFMCLNLYNKNKKHIQPTIEQQAKCKNIACKPFDSFFKNEIITKAFKIINENGDERTQKIFKIRYLECDGNKLTPWKKVGEQVGLSIQGVINVHNFFIQRIRKTIGE